ncbi:MAG TPA: hypothetical protein VHI55_09340 [Gaiellaceae bacterium]|jgi:hypothetical protein|nr:hypothetical protein [Gaiellaceae bacterium]
MRQASNPVTSHETATAAGPVVEPSLRGAETLAASYWLEVETTMRGLVRADAVDGHVDVRLLGRGPVLIRLGPPAVLADLASVTCTYPIVGGLLVGRPGGALALEQLNGDPVVLRSTLTEYVPSLAGALYFQVQARLHSLISRRYFARLGRDAQ